MNSHTRGPSDSPPWKFWIDVGGTFTDCFARPPDGTLLRHKLLSTGVTKGAVAAGSTVQCIVDPMRTNDPADFWQGFRLRLVDRNGRAVEEATVERSDARAAELRLARPLQSVPLHNQPYELVGSEEAPVLAIRYLMCLRVDETIPPVVMRLGTTRGTNALITRSGARTAFVTTRGFGDLLHIGYQNRPKLFDLNIRKPTPLFAVVVEIDERITHEGEVLKSIDSEIVRAQLADLKQRGIESLAICLLHASAHPKHERIIAEIARDVGFAEISVSSEVAPLVKIVPRGDTTVMDAYLNPVLRSYVGSLSRSLSNSDLRVLTSAGGLVSAERFCGKDSILSGPAGGVVGYSRIAQAAGFQRAIGFDMGGTSTDVSRFDGRLELEYETEKSGVRIVAPTLAIETVAAGGGSLCRFDGVKLVVGPESAGADPGPACYGRGGPLAVSDANVFLGRIVEERFPFPLDRTAIERKLTEVAAEIQAATGRVMSLVELADGFIQVANANMAKALRSISVAKGCDPREYLLVPFGGAAGQHACALAAELGIRQILFHPDAGLLSALGLGMSDHVRHRTVGVYRPYDEGSRNALAATFADLERQAVDDLCGDMPDEHNLPSRVEVQRSLDLRYQGIESALAIAEPADGDYPKLFEREHQRLYGYVQRDRLLEIVAGRVEAVVRSLTRLEPSIRVEGALATVRQRRDVCFDGKPQPTAVFESTQLKPGDQILGPAIVLYPTSTTVLEPGWQAEVLSQEELLATPTSTSLSDRRFAVAKIRNRVRRGGRDHVPVTDPDPIQLEIFNNHFAGIAEQMGIALRNTAVSVNVKERLDFSCAIFNSRGELVVNAPHLPVHLGAMSATVRRIIADNPAIKLGDVFVTNDPYRGGSHLPDVTVVTPVFMANDIERPVFFTASRAHHAEIGGMTPGSMPPFSTNLAEEGVLIRNFKLVDAHEPRFNALRELLLGGPHPTRAVDDNVADVTAQVAANRQGALALLSLAERHGQRVIKEYMDHLQNAAKQKLLQALSRFQPGRYAFTDYLDDGSPICAVLEISETGITIDFSGTGDVLPSNLNANPAITRAAVLYVLRTLIDEDIPLNDGIMSAVRIILPECLLNPPDHTDPRKCPAVVGGNVETSQRVVDVLLGAFGLAAASQGTMNNLLFGDATFGYYETICGGSGATATQAGADAVHTHMTNTRLTDPELLERRFPVRLLEFSIRRGSGGAGKRRGGDGVVRRIEFLRPLTVSILSQRRGAYPPYGAQGGQPGACGRNVLARADGTIEPLNASAQIAVRPGDVLSIETPGGGGWGTPEH
jgi:5-oxoprolinase (ATP-hydrolysing)